MPGLCGQRQPFSLKSFALEGVNVCLSADHEDNLQNVIGDRSPQCAGATSAGMLADMMPSTHLRPQRWMRLYLPYACRALPTLVVAFSGMAYFVDAVRDSTCRFQLQTDLSISNRHERAQGTHRLGCMQHWHVRCYFS